MWRPRAHPGRPCFGPAVGWSRRGAVSRSASGRQRVR
jgi:hypothetical protein